MKFFIILFTVLLIYSGELLPAYSNYSTNNKIIVNTVSVKKKQQEKIHNIIPLQLKKQI